MVKSRLLYIYQWDSIGYTVFDVDKKESFLPVTYCRRGTLIVTERKEVTGEWIKLRNEELHCF
jgi:hypothetical protein